MTRDNDVLGEFDLSGIPLSPRGVSKIEVAFDLDANGIPTAFVEELGTGIVENISIKNDKGRFTKKAMSM